MTRGCVGLFNILFSPVSHLDYVNLKKEKKRIVNNLFRIGRLLELVIYRYNKIWIYLKVI